ncbi:MAG TPA: hypothetical protein VMW49_05130 [Candidatus Dormibacteraeota bacterium]|nr:hypothetical protein [Candidatus Dormibacteraeota bacterium]
MLSGAQDGQRRGPAQFQELVRSSLRRLQKVPATVRGFFFAPDLRCIL